MNIPHYVVEILEANNTDDRIVHTYTDVVKTSANETTCYKQLYKRDVTGLIFLRTATTGGRYSYSDFGK